jgi:hypothetical protein
MGGPGSSRWGITVTRMTTEGLPRLDVRVLARQGALRPGTTATVTWDSGASVTTTVTTDAPDCLRLAYVVVDRRGVGRSVTARVPLLTTPGTVGGVRAWFGCPGCGRRCAVLHALGGRFRCRGCHHLTCRSIRTPG